jgi:hypothetical protein
VFALLVSGVNIEVSNVSRSDRAMSLYWRISVCPCAKKLGNSGREGILVVVLVKGAVPLVTPKLLCQIANGVSDRPSKKRCLMLVAKGCNFGFCLSCA